MKAPKINVQTATILPPLRAWWADSAATINLFAAQLHQLAATLTIQ
jgi:hypothetical protein